MDSTRGLSHQYSKPAALSLLLEAMPAEANALLILQIQATAEVLSRPDVQSHAERFNFKQYMVNRAELVNDALDAAVPLQYPEAVVESMRYAQAACLFDVSVCNPGIAVYHQVLCVKGMAYMPIRLALLVMVNLKYKAHIHRLCVYGQSSC